MSHEILLIAGSAQQDAQTHRRLLVNHAAGRVPGATSWAIHETEHATLALVNTEPAGGSVAYAAPDGALGMIVVIAGSDEAAAAAVAASFAGGRRFGAEAGHVKVMLARAGTVEIQTDGIGFLPSYWSMVNGDLYFSTHLASLISLGVEPVADEIGMLEYLVALHPFLNRTILRGVSLLPAGGTIQFSPGSNPKVETQRLYVPSDESMSDDAAVGEFRRVWEAIISDISRRTVGRRASLGISAGLDSRAIASQCASLGFRPFTFTYGSLESAEVRGAAQVAQILGLDHAIIPVTQDRQLSGARLITELLDGAHSAAEMYELWFSDTVIGFTDVLINGLAGGPLWGDDKAMGVSDPARVLNTQLARYSPELDRLAKFLVPDLAHHARDLFRRSLIESMAEWDLSKRSDMVLFWKIHNRQFRWGNPLTNALRRAGLRIEAPFLDSRFLAFSARLTPAQKLNGRLYLRVHREVFSRTSRVSRESDGNAPQHLDHAYWSGQSSYFDQLAHLAIRHPVSAARRVARRISGQVAERLPNHGLLSGTRRRIATRDSVFPAELWLRDSKDYQNSLVDLLQSSTRIPILSTGTTAQIIRDVRSGQVGLGALQVGKIATLQSWLDDYTRRERERPAII